MIRPFQFTLRRSGFSLIELFAVGISLGLLSLLVQPSLLTARQASKLSVCLDRLREVGKASAAYAANDASGFGLPAHPGDFSAPLNAPVYTNAYVWAGKSGIGEADFVAGYGSTDLGSKYGTAAGRGPASRPLNTYLYPHGFKNHAEPSFDRVGATADTQLALDKLRCPGDDGPPRGAHCPDWVQTLNRTSFDHFGNSYSANLFMVWASGSVLAPGFDPGEMGTNSPYLRPASRVPSPVRTIFFEENISRWAWATRRESDSCYSSLGIPGVDPGPTKAVRGWHDKDWTFNRVFGDAHAGRQRIYIEGTEDADGYATHYVNESVFPDEPGRDEYSRCIIIRGPGWQKDTLPAPFVRTGRYHTGSGRPSYEGCVE